MMAERDELYVTFDGQAGFQLRSRRRGPHPLRRAPRAPAAAVDAQLLRGAAAEAEMERAVGPASAPVQKQPRRLRDTELNASHAAFGGSSGRKPCERKPCQVLPRPVFLAAFRLRACRPCHAGRRATRWDLQPALRLGVSLLMLTTIAEILNLVLLNVPVVLLERARELVRAVVAADEVQEVGVGRMDRGLERRAAGRRDRPRRQARDTDRCCTASRTTDRPCGCCRRSGRPCTSP